MDFPLSTNASERASSSHLTWRANKNAVRNRATTVTIVAVPGEREKAQTVKSQEAYWPQEWDSQYRRAVEACSSEARHVRLCEQDTCAC